MGCKNGERLLNIERKQMEKWQEKYNKLGKSNASSEEFYWAMEAVHSRAFKGLGSSNGVTSSIGLLALQALAVIGGAYGVLQANQIGDYIGVACATVAIAPLILRIVRGEDKNVVLLPFIDSANHFEQADSSIEYDQLKDCFTLNVGRNCFVEDIDSKVQLCISYGQRKDSELLLNYGFINDIVCAGSTQEDQRDQLAKEFLQRYS